jgi:hypothetical protein
VRKIVDKKMAALLGLEGVQIVHLKRGAAARRPRGKPTRRESSIENSIVQWCHADERKSRTRKMNGYGFNSWPDRQVLPPTVWQGLGRRVPHPELRERRPLWAEVKRPGEEATEAQDLIHQELRTAGQVVVVVHSLEEFIGAYEAHFNHR